VTVRAHEAVRTLVTTRRHVTLGVTVTTAALSQTVLPPSAAWTSYKNRKLWNLRWRHRITNVYQNNIVCGTVWTVAVHKNIH